MIDRKISVHLVSVDSVDDSHQVLLGLQKIIIFYMRLILGAILRFKECVDTPVVGNVPFMYQYLKRVCEILVHIYQTEKEMHTIVNFTIFRKIISDMTDSLTCQLLLHCISFAKRGQNLLKNLSKQKKWP